MHIFAHTETLRLQVCQLREGEVNWKSCECHSDIAQPTARQLELQANSHAMRASEDSPCRSIQAVRKECRGHMTLKICLSATVRDTVEWYKIAYLPLRHQLPKHHISTLYNSIRRIMYRI